jgi:hypothetical protein
MRVMNEAGPVLRAATPAAPHRRVRMLSLALVVALAATLVPSAPAHANITVQTGNTKRELGGLSSQTLDIRLSGGQRVRGNVLRFRDSANLELRPHLANGTVAGMATMPTMVSREYAKGAIAGVNGGYFLARPWGAPNGLFVDRGRKLAGDAVMASGGHVPRAVAGIASNGSIIGDKLKVSMFLDSPETGVAAAPLHDLNRAPLATQTDRAVLYDSRYGTAAPARAGELVLVLDEIRMTSGGRASGVVRERYVPTTARTYTVAQDTSLLIAGGTSRTALNGLAIGHSLGVTSQIQPLTVGANPADWHDLRGAIPGAGLLVKNGAAQSGASHGDQAINHATTRRARTAVGRHQDGLTLLVTIDEGSSSAGVTLFELGVIMRDLGAVDAVALDGGGSSTMAVNARTVNRPSDPNRSHSSALFVYAPLPPPSRSTDAACPPGRVPDAGFGDIGGNTHATAINCLAWWNVTQGLSDTQYGPGGSVSRQQMASFLARWLDDIAARGQGQALPATATHSFVDVREGSAHEVSIARLAAAGVLSGTSETTFNPAAPVTRAQTATLVANAIQYSRSAGLPDAPDTFMDDNTNRHEPNIDRLAHVGVIGGTGGYNFTPDAPVTRAAMASLVMRATDLLVTEGRVQPPA